MARRDGGEGGLMGCDVGVVVSRGRLRDRWSCCCCCSGGLTRFVREGLSLADWVDVDLEVSESEGHLVGMSGAGM